MQIQAVLRRMPFQHLTSALFLLLTAVLLAAGLGEVVRGAQLSAFVPVGTLAALIGWGLGTRRLNGWLTWVMMILGGAAVLWVSTAQFGGPLLRLVDSIPTFLLQSIRWAWNQKVAPDFSSIASVWPDLVTQSQGLLLRVSFWLRALQSGENRYDPVIYVLAWSFLLWLTAAWQGWFMRREQVLTASIPSLLLLAELAYMTGADTLPLWSVLTITLLLMGLVNFRAIFVSWAKRRIDYADIILDTTITSIAIATFSLAALAWTLPSFSLQDLMDKIHKYSTPVQEGPTMAERLGLQNAASKDASTEAKDAETLFDVHSIGPGPDLSRDLVMSIRTGEISPGQLLERIGSAPYHRWRSNTMDRYTGHGWSNSPVSKLTYAADVSIFPQVPARYRILRQTVRVALPLGERVYWDGILQSVDQPFAVGWRTKPQPNLPANANPFADADPLGAFSKAESYQATSLLTVVGEDQLRAASVAYPNVIRQRYLRLPENIPERVFALAREVTATAPTAYDQARALETYLRKTYPYTLNIPAPPADQDVVDYFLFDLKKGFCDYYATAMIVMARSVGLPARIVFGYANGSYDPIKGEYNIVKADAHAWVEVYFPKIGWVEFDPTSNRPEIDRLINDDQLANQPNIASPSSDSLLDFYQRYAPALLYWGVWGAAALLTLICILLLGEFWLLTTLPAARAMQLIYRGLYRVGRNAAGAGAPGQTADEFAALLNYRLNQLSQKRILRKALTPANTQLKLLTDLYLRAMYTPYPLEKTDVRTALRTWYALRWRLLLAGLFYKYLHRNFTAKQ